MYIWKGCFKDILISWYMLITNLKIYVNFNISININKKVFIYIILEIYEIIWLTPEYMVIKLVLYVMLMAKGCF